MKWLVNWKSFKAVSGIDLWEFTADIKFCTEQNVDEAHNKVRHILRLAEALQSGEQLELVTLSNSIASLDPEFHEVPFTKVVCTPGPTMFKIDQVSCCMSGLTINISKTKGYSLVIKATTSSTEVRNWVGNTYNQEITV